jgi:ParB/RepB/Spo0J family partition protein
VQGQGLRVMGRRKYPQGKANTMPAPAGTPGASELRIIPLDLLIEPETAMRATMDEAKLGELRESMHELGLLYPLIAFPKESGFEVVDGHRRLLCARALKWVGVPVLIFAGAAEAREAAKLHANEIREAINPAEEAVFIAQLIDKYRLTEEGVCRMMHRNPDYIGDRLRLLRQDPQVFDALRRGDINFGVARELNKCEDEGMRRYFLDCAIRNGGPVRVVIEWIQNWRASQAVMGPTPAAPAGGAPTQPLEVYHDHCYLCGGDRDPGNLISIRVHRWEWEAFLHEWEKTAKGET